jgi:hypothetical protein
MARIPLDAFDYYVSLGPARSYQAVAEKLGVSKRAVTMHATKENWQARLEKARSAADEKARETLEAMNERHLQALRVIQGKALSALKGMSLDTAMDAVRALDLGIKQERLIRGQPSDRQAVTVEEIVKREYEQWMEDEDVERDEASEDPAE